MNKKGELIAFSVIVLLLVIAGIWVYQGDVEKKTFIGDASTKVVYNFKSLNPNCNLQEIRIERQNMRLFSTLEEAQKQGFMLSSLCN